MAKRKGKIIPNGVVLEKHEMATVVFLTEQGFDIEFIPPSTIEGIKTPDLVMNDLKWEMKSPGGHGRWTIENQLKRAVKQSQNVILDGRRVKMPNEQIIREVSKQFEMFKGIKRLILITKQSEVLDFYK